MLSPDLCVVLQHGIRSVVIGDGSADHALLHIKGLGALMASLTQKQDYGKNLCVFEDVCVGIVQRHDVT